MIAIECSRCHEPLEEGIRRTGPNMLCKECMDSFFEWKKIIAPRIDTEVKE